MNPFDDRQPEEKDPQFEELIALLQRANLDPMIVDPTERTQILSQARARLFPTDPEVSRYEDMVILQVRGLGSFQSKPKAGTDKPHRGRRLIRLASALAAVLVVAALIGSALLLFGPLREDLLSTTPSNQIFGTPKRVGPFEMSLKITPSPYFLDELLEVDLSITNDTRTAYWLDPRVNKNPQCPNFLNIAMTAGGSPHVTDFEHFWAGLPWPSPNCNSLAQELPTAEILVETHQTITIKQYVQLTSSGQVTLTIRMVSLEASAGSGTSATIPASAPWGSVSISVSPRIPSDRQLSVKQQKTQVVVSGPPAVNGHLLLKTGSVCAGSGGGAYIESPGSPPGTTVVVKPSDVACGFGNTLLSAPPVWWAYVVGAPGYPVYFGMVNGS